MKPNRLNLLGGMFAAVVMTVASYASAQQITGTPGSRSKQLSTIADRVARAKDQALPAR